MNKISTLLALVAILGFSLATQLAFGQKSETGSAKTEVFFDDFSYPLGQLPDNWTIDGDPMLWTINNSQMAGGQAPELALGYSFVFGTCRVVSAPVNIAGHDKLKLSYKQYLLNYEMDYGEIIGLDVAFNGTTEWQTIWQRPLGVANIPQGLVDHYISLPTDATTIQIAFRYEGNSYAINWWLIDDISLSTVADNDLICASFNGPAVPVIGKQGRYLVDVLNGGQYGQTNYTVKLKNNNGDVLTSSNGATLAYGEKTTCELLWTPQNNDLQITSLFAIVDFSQDENPENNLSATLAITVQPENVTAVQIGTNEFPVNFLPYNFFNNYSMTQTMYYPGEIGISGDSIIGIMYKNQFDENLDDMQLQLFLGETNLAEMSDEEWVNPQDFVNVFNGTLDFLKGPNQTYIPFDVPYRYTGQNLIVYSVKGFDQGYIFGPVFYCSVDSANYRSRAAEDSNMPFDPMNPPSYGYTMPSYPNITLFFKSSESAIESHESNQNTIAIYPNPSSNIVNIDSKELIREVKIIDASGRVLRNENCSGYQRSISVYEMQAGIYVVQVLTDRGITAQKLQIVK